jgi:hypothetical protein
MIPVFLHCHAGPGILVKIKNNLVILNSLLDDLDSLSLGIKRPLDEGRLLVDDSLLRVIQDLGSIKLNQF